MPEAVTLADPAKYFEALDQASLKHWWGRSIEHVERRWLRHALRKAAPLSPPPWSWLDIGCGTGTRMRLWANWGCWGERVGVEPEIEAVEAAGASPALEILPGELPELPAGLGRFDVVTALDVLQHVAAQRRRDSIRSIADRLRPGGILLLRTNAPGLFRGGANDTTIVDAACLHHWAAEAGLRVTRSSRFNVCGGLAEDVARVARSRMRRSREAAPFKSGLPAAWQRRPAGHALAGWCAFVESRISGTGLVNFPIGHSYLVMAIKDGNHDRTTDGKLG